MCTFSSPLLSVPIPNFSLKPGLGAIVLNASCTGYPKYDTRPGCHRVPAGYWWAIVLRMWSGNAKRSTILISDLIPTWLEFGAQRL